jgi:hypothetical protein
MGKDKYKSVYYRHFLRVAEKCEEDVIYRLKLFKCDVTEISRWIQVFEELKEMIENHKVCARSKVTYLKKCDKLTHEMGIFIKAQQSLEKFKLTVHQNS